MLESNRTRTEQGHSLHPKKAWDCGCGQHLEATGDEALIARVLYHLEVQHPEAHFTLEEGQGLVTTEAYEVLAERLEA